MGDVFQVIVTAMPELLSGLQKTIYLTIASLILATVLGLIIGLMSLSTSRWVLVPARLYVNIIRGTPLLVQILFIYFGLPAVIPIKLSAITAGIIAIGFHIGAYVSEVFRAGIESIDNGQIEAGRSLGLSSVQTMRKIVVPQAVRRMMPPLLNQYIIGVKDTSLLAVIGVAELTERGQTIYAANYRAFEILAVVGLMYLALTYTLYRLSLLVEKRFVIA